MESGEVVTVIDHTYKFDEAIEAIKHVGAGHTRGTTVITMAEESVS